MHILFPHSDPSAIAFVMPNQSYQAPYPLEPYLRSIDWIEERSGVDFMPELDAGTEAALEREPARMWK